MPDKLERTETLVADKDLKIKGWWIAIPSTADNSRVVMNNQSRTDIFSGKEGALKVTANADWKFDSLLKATGDSKLGKGVLGAIPLHLIYSAENIELKKGGSHRSGG